MLRPLGASLRGNRGSGPSAWACSCCLTTPTQWRRASTSAQTLDGHGGADASQDEAKSTWKQGKTGATQTDGRRPRVIFSGIQPTGIPHLGNFLGAMRNWVDIQRAAHVEDELFFSIVGLHAITVPQSPKRLRTERRDMIATLLAIGLDPERATIFHQDEVREHAELAWYLNCITPVGKLNRMTTWKSKLATIRNAQSEEDVDETHLSLGLFAYPVLQAADILLYHATHVPVGEDQVQHLELSRDIADLYNRTFKKRLFPLPQHIITPTKRILSLRDPAQKMSKSAPDASSRILLTDSDDDIARKIKRAVTDSEARIAYDPQSRPGVSNLLAILAALQAEPTTRGGSSDGSGAIAGDMDAESESPRATQAATAWAEHLNGMAGSSGHTGRVLKEAVTDAIITTLRPIRAELQRLQADTGFLQQVEKCGRDKAAEKAAFTMAQVRCLAGLAD